MVANKFTSFRIFTLFVDVCWLHLQEWWDEDQEQEEEESEEPALLWPFFSGQALGVAYLLGGYEYPSGS